MSKAKKLLCLFDYKCNTGFATVSQNIISQLKKHFGKDVKFDICAINYFGEPYEEDENILVFSAKKSAPKDDDFGRFGFLKILKESDEYDGVLIIQDLGVIVPIIEVLKYIQKDKKERNVKNFKSIFYFPIDCEILPQLVRGLEFFDCIITYTEYARKQVFKFKPDLKGKLKVIFHGININHFYPLETDKAKEFRLEYFGKENTDKFIILNLNRNQPRKDIPTTIFAFIEAKKIWEEGLPKPFLYLHMNPKDPMGWDIKALILQTDLVEGVDYKLIPDDIENHGAGIELVNKIYNASDVYLSTTLGEGWGLGLTEAFACKLPVIAPYNTSIIEIGGYNSERIMHLETQIPYANTIDNVFRQQSDYVEVAQKLLYSCKNRNSENLNQMVGRAYEWVKKLEWSIVSKLWIDYIKQTY